MRDDTNDIDPSATPPRWLAEALANCRLARPDHSGYSLIDDRNLGGVRVVVLGKPAAGDEPDPERREVLWGHRTRVDVGQLLRRACSGLEVHRIGLPADERNPVHQAGVRNAGYGPDGFDQSRIIGSDLLVRGALATRYFERQRGDALGAEAEIHPCHIDRALEQQGGADEQRKRARDLRGDTDSPCRRAPAPGGRRPSSLFGDGREVRPPRMDRRRNTRRTAGEDE